MPSLTAPPGTSPAPVDLADRWLLDAALHLVAACGLPEYALTSLGTPDVRPLDALVRPGGAASLEDASLAVLLGATAVETRLNHLLRVRDPSDWHTVAHLTPEEKFGLAPRLLRPREPTPLPPEHHELSVLAATLFAVRAGLVEDVEFAPPTVVRARTLVHAAARICSYLTHLADPDQHEREEDVASFVERVAAVLAPRARALSTPHTERHVDWSWSRDVDFPPDLVGS